MIRTSLDDGNPRDPQIALLIDRAGAPVLRPNGLLVEVKLHVRRGTAPHRTVYHGNIRYGRHLQVGAGRWIYTEKPLRTDGWVLADDDATELQPSQTWGPVN